MQTIIGDYQLFGKLNIRKPISLLYLVSYFFSFFEVQAVQVLGKLLIDLLNK